MKERAQAATAAGRDRGHRSPGSPCWRRWCWRCPPCATPSAPRSRATTREVRNEIDSLGAWGPLLILGLTLIHSVVFYPAEIVNAAAGFAYGFFPALVLVMVGWMLSALLCFAIGRSVARPLLDRWVGAERFERIEADDRARRRDAADRRCA